nr:hypothetical protein [Mycobacterium uberis]
MSPSRDIPWESGGPQPVVQQLIAFGGLCGEVLDQGIGPGITPSTMRRKTISTTVVNKTFYYVFLDDEEAQNPLCAGPAPRP